MPKLKPGTIWPTPAKVDLTKGQLDEIAAGSMTFDEIEEKYGEEIAIEVGILRDPDNPEWTAEDFARARELLEAVRTDLDARAIEGDNRIAKVSVVGVGMRSHAGVATRMFDALAADNINIRMISTSEIKISVVVDERYLELAVRAIHSAFDLSDPPAKD